MAGPCNSTFERLAHDLGGKLSCTSGNAVVNVRAPWELTNWTLPVIEALLVGGAIYAVVHALRRWRAGDPTTLALQLASLVFLFVIEPPVYFPDQIRLPGQTEIVFAHNAFTVEFLWDRLPLYIIALYLAMFTLAFEIVRSLGVFQHRGILAGALSVGFVHHCFYEVFDHLGPQLQWWTWNSMADASHPMVASVPLTSIVVFATAAPAALAGAIYWLVGKPHDRGIRTSGATLVGRAFLAGLLTLVATALAGLPWRIFNTDDPNAPTQIIAMTALVAAIVISGAIILVLSWRRQRTDGPASETAIRRYAQRYGWTYLVVMAGLWISALPAYLGAINGMTTAGTPTGSLPYAALSYLAAAGSLLLVATAKPKTALASGSGILRSRSTTVRSANVPGAVTSMIE
jgi:hypothetical protein